jgi:hypothetical protein
MSKSKPTIGPWEQSGAYVYSQGGNVCACGDPRAASTVGYTKLEFNSADMDEAFANARLISAAPNLLWVIERIIEDLPINKDWLDPAVEREARAAIKKAKGEL